MEVNQTFDSFLKIKKDCTMHEINSLLNICKKLNMGQKVISVVFYNFYNARSNLSIEPDDVILYSTIIDMAFKMVDVSRPIEPIINQVAEYFNQSINESDMKLYLETIYISQLNYLIESSCDIVPPFPYNQFIDVFRQNKFPTEIYEQSWIFLNDLIVYTPAIFIFSETECIYSAIYIAFLLIYGSNTSGETEVQNLASCEANFKIKFKLSEDDTAVIYFLSDQLVSIYEQYGTTPQ